MQECVLIWKTKVFVKSDDVRFKLHYPNNFLRFRCSVQIKLLAVRITLKFSVPTIKIIKSPCLRPFSHDGGLNC